ncbi:hypothetical protein HCDG_05653 [Histoplasma capsulatum H143]|uniref:Uncharacterized protein n=1 Tax=Ajellomyces capsulatus (strain H143) TaxID=544712 RepID=C6HHH2_AJECH|nr:hypothetical protein HCDG_05653 [Histoplasma capsulatum H143]
MGRVRTKTVKKSAKFDTLKVNVVPAFFSFVLFLYLVEDRTD